MIIVVIGILVVKGSIMNSKLLKICAAILMIAGAGNVVGMDKGLTSNNHDVGKKEQSIPEEKSSELQVEGIVKAVLEVKFGEESKIIKLIEDDGKTMTDDKDRQFDFSVDTNCANPKIKLEPVKQFEFEDGKGWSLTDGTGKYKLKVNIALQHNNGKEFDDIAWDQSGSSHSIKKEDRRGNTAWRLFFEPYLDKAQEPGIYAGAVKVVIDAA